MAAGFNRGLLAGNRLCSPEALQGAVLNIAGIEGEVFKIHGCSPFG